MLKQLSFKKCLFLQVTQHFHFEFETDEVARCFLQRAIIFDAVLRWHKPDKGFDITLFYNFYSFVNELYRPSVFPILKGSIAKVRNCQIHKYLAFFLRHNAI